MKSKPREIYIHIPFCVRKCAYCDFLSFPSDEETREQYVQALCREITGAGRDAAETVYLGGGTPSVLSGEQIGRIMDTVRSAFELADDAEISMECNPGTVDADKLSAFRAAGINRISFGLQSVHEDELTLLGRIHSYREFEKNYHAARAAGFDNINVDLMFGLPGQDTGDLAESIRRVAELEPEHISLYSLILEKGTYLYEHHDPLPDEKAERKMYRDACRMLGRYGYEQYEISNFAKPGFVCRHNDGYWTGAEYYGFGLGASGYVGGVRYRNEQELKTYLSAAEQISDADASCRGITGRSPVVEEFHEVTEKEAIEEFMFLGLRRIGGISEREFKDRFAYEIRDIYGEVLRKLKDGGLIKKQGSRWSLTRKGIDVSNVVLAEFLLDQIPAATVHISVRELVEFLLREGDLDRVSVRGAANVDAMQMGAQIHRMLQDRRGIAYQAEVPLTMTFPMEQVTLIVEGRADGIEEDVIEEIKSTALSLNELKEPKVVHLAQAKCYAAIYAREQGLEEVGVRMTYCQVETKKVKCFEERYQAAELWTWFTGLTREYEKWAVLRGEGMRERDRSIASIRFPYPYREGQKRMVSAVYRTICDEKQLFVQAPTGSGKTLAAIYPAVRALGEGKITKIWYLTAKTVTRTVAREALTILREEGLKMHSVVLTARDRICFREETVCDPETCGYAKGHFDRINDALYELLTENYICDRETICRIAEQHKVCPYALSLDAARWADTVIADYNYVLDPEARMLDYFLNGRKKSDLYLIDEAHNLVERGRGMYSAVIRKEDVLALRRIIKERDQKLATALTALNRVFLGWRKAAEAALPETPDKSRKRVADDLDILSLSDIPDTQLLNIKSRIERLIEREENEPFKVTGQDREEHKLPDELWDFYFGLLHFLNMYDCADERFCVYLRLKGHGRMDLTLYCLDPSAMLTSYLEQGTATVFFSATLLPIKYYETLLTVKEDFYDLYAQSPFDPAHLLLAVGTDVTSLYKRRSESVYARYAQYIEAAVSAKPGNYLVYFPSYAFMENVAELVFAGHQYEGKRGGDTNTRWLIQERDMTEQAKADFLAAFHENDSSTLVGLCVLGGAFAEGIDLQGEDLIGVIVVGTGIPQVGSRLDLTKEYFDGVGEDGFSYTYLYPGFNKVMQAVGRVIRTVDDRGVALLLDARFDTARYRRLFPREWQQVQTCTIDTISDTLHMFWDRRE